MLDVAGYLRRIAYDGPLRPDADTLTALHRAHLATVPYENIDIQLGRAPALHPDALYDKIVRRRRGGFCFELNGCFALLLAAAGFRVRHVEAAVHLDRDGDSAWGNHLALLVATEQGRFLADVGFGDGFLEPLPLRTGAHRQGRLTFHLERGPAGSWRMVHHPDGAAPGFDFRTGPRRLPDFAPRCARLATDAESPFVRTLLVQQPRTDHALVLRARNLLRRGPGGAGSHEIDDRAEFEAVLADEFGVPVGELDADDRLRLWQAATEQHVGWLVRQSGVPLRL